MARWRGGEGKEADLVDEGEAVGSDGAAEERGRAGAPLEPRPPAPQEPVHGAAAAPGPAPLRALQQGSGLLHHTTPHHTTPHHPQTIATPTHHCETDLLAASFQSSPPAPALRPPPSLVHAPAPPAPI